MIQFRLLAVAVTAAGLLATMPAAAVVKVAKYVGTLGAGYDLTGVFGAANTDLTGAGYVATYTYDKDLGGSLNTDGVTFEESIGGSAFGDSSPIITAEITIRGVTKTVYGTYYGWAYTSTSRLVQHYASDFSDDGVTRVGNRISALAVPLGAPGSLDQNFGPVASPFTGYGEVLWQTLDETTGTQIEYAIADLGTDAVYSVSDPGSSAVPEPASWQLLIAGLGMFGATLRRRPRSGVAT